MIATASPGVAPSMVHAGLGCVSGDIWQPRASFTIDTSALREEGAAAAVARQLRGGADALLRRASVVQGGGAWDSVVAVTVEPLAGAQIGYASSIRVERSFGDPSEVQELRCELCTEGELVVQILSVLDGLVPALADRRW